MIVPPHVLAAIRQPAFVYRPEGIVEAANDHAEALAGGPLAGTTPADLVARLSIRHHDGTPLLPRELPPARALRGEEAVDVPLTVTTADGRTVHILATSSPIVDGDTVAGVLSVWQDVTARVGAEEAVRESEAHQRALAESLDVERGRLATVLEHLPVGVWIADAHGHLIGKNPEADRIWAGDAPLVQSIGEYTSYLVRDPGTEAELAPEEYPLARALLTGEPTGPVELRIDRFDGTHGTVLASAEPIRDRSGRPAGAVGINVDITERKRAEEALRKSEERFRAVQENSLDRFTILRPCYNDRGEIVDFSYLYQNARAARTAGRSPDELIGRRMTEIWPTFPQTRFFAIYRSVVENGQATEFEERYQADGVNDWFRTTVTPIPDGIAVATEIVTERKRAEDALRESEKLYRRLFETTENGFALVEPIVDATGRSDDYRVLKVNAAWERQTGLRAADVVGRGFREAMPDVEPPWAADFAGVARTDVARHFESCNTASGRWFDLHAFPYREGQVGVLFREITERKETELALVASEARYRALFETMNEGFMVVEPVVDEHGVPVSFRHLEVNPAKERISGRTREELVGRDARETAPGIEDRFVQTYARVARTGEPAHIEEYAAGLGRWLSANVYSPEPGTAAVVVSDVTVRKEAEEALRESKRRQAFLLALGDTLRELGDPAAIAAAASELVGRHLGANGVVYCEIDEAGECATVRADWNDGTVPSAAGTFRMDDFGIGDLYRRGEVRRTSDVALALGTDEAGEHEALRIRASMGIPICRGGRLAAVLAVHSTAPRAWTDAEVGIVRRAGDRIWAAVERAQAEAALAESEADARSFMASMIDAVAICETVADAAGEPADLRVVEANPAVLQGLSLAEGEVVGRTVSALLPAMDRSWFERFIEVARTRRSVAFEEPFPASGRWYQLAAFPVRGGRIAVVLHDITDQREAETALRERDLRLNLALDVADVGVFDWNPLTGEETWDDRIRQQWGLPPGAPVDHAVFEAGVHPDDRAAVAEANRQALDPAGDGRYAARYRVIGFCDGVERRIESRGQAFFEANRAARMIGTTIDVSERERAEEAVRAHERLLQSIYRAAPAGIGLVSGIGPERRFEQVNDHLLEMTGYDRGELVGLRTRILYPDEETHASVGEESASLLEAFGRGEVESRWRCKDGTVIDVLLSSSLIDPANPASGVIFTALDITELHETEKALMRYARDLRQSNEELQRFAYVASHDLQEPLRSIVSFSQLLERRYRGKLDTDADEFIGFIVEGGNRMQRLIADLLQVSRVETQAKPFEPTCVEEVVAGVLRAMETPLREAGAIVTVGELPAVMADAAQLEQVFANLVSNALKYRHPDRPPAIAISVRAVNPAVEFAVADNGIGIEEEYFDRIFEMFRRLHTHDKYEGTGIGLAVVKRIVERHGGSVRVESTPGEGSTFFFTLPAA